MECSVCYEQYSGDVSLKRRPQILPCGHEACESCIEQLHASNYNAIKCPMCQARHVTPPSCLPIVYALIQSATTTRNCDDDNCTDTAYIECPHCNKRFCSDHFHEHQNEVLDICSVFLFEVEEKIRRNTNIKDSIVKLSKNANDKNDEIKRRILDLRKLSIDFQKTVDELENLLNSVSEKESTAKPMLDDLKSAIQSRKSIDKVWKRWKLLENNPELHIDVQTHVARVEALYSRFDLLFSSSSPYNSDSSLPPVDFGAIVISNTDDENLSNFETIMPSQLSDSPKKIVKLDRKPMDLAVVYCSSDFSLRSGFVVRGQDGRDLPFPALLVKMSLVNNHILVCDDEGEVKGKIRLRYFSAGIERITVRNDSSDILMTDINYKRVIKLSLDGEKFKTSEDFFSKPVGLCCLPNDRVAVCDETSKTVRILSYEDLSLIQTIKHGSFISPLAVTATSSHLVVTNRLPNARLVFLSLDDFSNVKFGEDELDHPVKLLHYNGHIFLTTGGNKVIQMSESGVHITTLGGSRGFGYYQNFTDPIGLEVISSRNGEDVLVVADWSNLRLKFYKI